MSNEPATPAKDEAPVSPAATPASPPPAGKGSRVGALVLVCLIVFSLLWYFVADRLTPHTSQARVQAYVVPVAAEVSGKVLKVYVKNNDEVQAGQRLFDIDASPYQITLQRSRSDYESIRRSVVGSTATVAAAEAALQAAITNAAYTKRDAARLEQIYATDPGALSVRRVQQSQNNRALAASQEKAAEADLRRAKEAAGDEGERNAQLLSARAAIEKAELDVKRTQVVAATRGLVTDLRTEVGQFTQPGAPAMTLISNHDFWIAADMTENNLGNIKVGDQVDILLDVMPGEILKGRIRSLGNGVASGKQSQVGTLPTIENNRDWLRQAQRFPVVVEFEPAELKRLKGVRIGGQAEVMVYTGDHGLMNWLGAAFMGLVSYLSFLY